MGDRDYTIAGGLCKVLDDKITILAMTSEEPSKIDVARAQSAQKKAESRVHAAEHMSDIEQVKWQRKLDRAKARLSIAEKKK
jgi:F-type H+-transporting ATPase subunit epsilon